MMAERFFEDVAVGDALPEREFGPFTIGDGVRWAGCLELWNPLHFDREYARENTRGLHTFIASGAYRQALLARTLTEWSGPRGRLRKLRLRHTGPVFEGDTMRFSGRVVERSENADEPWLACDLTGINQRGEQFLVGRCVLFLAGRADGGER
jgi:acyl dehydratase